MENLSVILLIFTGAMLCTLVLAAAVGLPAWLGAGIFTRCSAWLQPRLDSARQAWPWLSPLTEYQQRAKVWREIKGAPQPINRTRAAEILRFFSNPWLYLSAAVILPKHWQVTQFAVSLLFVLTFTLKAVTSLRATWLALRKNPRLPASVRLIPRLHSAFYAVWICLAAALFHHILKSAADG